MGLLEQLQEQGWYITQPGLDKLLEGEKNGSTANVDVKQVVKLALNTDLREYGGGALSSLAARGTKSETFEGHGVVQLVKLRNLGAPKVNEESKAAPRLLKLTVTDGQTQFVALEHEHIPSLSLNTPPGTKILLKNGPIRIIQGVMMLSEKNVQVLGGHVTALVEKWELSRTMAKFAKGGRLQFSASGPPPWIPFGQKIQQPVAAADKDFKSLQPKEKEESTENTAFNALRNDAIAEATKLGTKKTFGGGAKQMVDANVQKIMDKGFTEDQATHALKLTRNNVHRALSNLQRIEDRKQAQADSASGGGKVDGGKSGGKRGFGKRDDDAEMQSKPSGKVSLFEYFGDILQDTESASTTAGTSGGGKKSSSKESTPNEKEQNRARSDSAARQTGNNRHPPSKNQPAGGTNRSQGDNGSSHNSTAGMVNGGSSKTYNQRFENNISSSFANRNTTTSSSGRGGERARNDQHSSQQGQSQYSNQSRETQRDQQSSYKQSDYYGSSGNSRYRGTNTNDNHSSSSSNHPSASTSARGGNSRGGDSKYNQSHQTSGYSHSSQQQRQDGYNNNSSNSNATAGGKYNGKGQSNNNTAGYGNSSYGSEGRSHQQQSSQYGHGSVSHENRPMGGGGSGKSGSGTQGTSNQQHTTSQQQSSYGNASKQSGYHNQHQGSGSSYNSSAANGNNVHNQYNQQASGSNHGNNYGGGANNGSKNSTKNSRYGGKDESHKYTGVNASQSTTNNTQQSKKGPVKTHGSQQHSNTAQNNATDQHSSYGTAGGSKQGVANTTANSKMNQVTEQMGSMQVTGSKASGYSATNTGNNTSNAPASSSTPSATNKPVSMKQTNTNNTNTATVTQPHPPQIASPPGIALPTTVTNAPVGPGGPSPGVPVAHSPGVGVSAGGPPSVPKNFIQLPNGYNYNPYQIMGFQNKQTNEFALNVLKSQQQFDPMQQQPMLGTPGPVPPTVSPVGPNVVSLTPNVTPSGVLAQPPPPPAAVLATAPSPGSVPTHGTLAPTTMSMAPAMAPPTATISAVYPNWKIGDRCLAKYWEDGGFYTAEITDTSKNTFVVHFLEYGNYEEVLKTDCIPITQTAAPAAPAPMTLSYHPAPAQPHMPPPHPAAAPVPFAPHPGHPHLAHQHHHGHVQHHAPPMAAAPGAYQAPMQDMTHGAQHAHYAPFKPGPMAPVGAPIPTPPGQGQLPPAMNQYQPTQHHLHQPQQQQQQHHLSQQQQGGHMPQHHHQSQMSLHGQQRPGGKFREQRPMYVPPAQRK
ncbi:tudor domain-containing protein 3 [Anopheles marshallii]|uniref:tudor domain-containing protein 3 n=1 Tax=Anopheles marshallii TaxID=1521116 RepID=UPI00237BAFB0|nr:tudor domain-containing protein 3 [Anopheles marshallii]